MRRLLVAALIITAMGCGTTQQSLTVSPQVTMFAFKPVWVRAMFQVPPGLECARAEWVWGDGSKSVRMSDPVDGKCETVLIERHLYRQTGDMTVSLRLKTADREQLFSTWLVIKE